MSGNRIEVDHYVEMIENYGNISRREIGLVVGYPKGLPPKNKGDVLWLINFGDGNRWVPRRCFQRVKNPK